MSQNKLYVFTFLILIIFISEVNSWDNAQELYGLRKLDFFRRKFGPVKMLSHAGNGTDNSNSSVSEIPLKAENEINPLEQTIETQIDDDEATGIVQKVVPPTSVTDDPIVRKEQGFPPARPVKAVEDHSKKNCWMDASAKEHFELMDGLDDRYASVREKYQEAAEKDNFSKDMIDMMIKTRGVAHREIHKAKGDPSVIPAGINLGGYGMLRLDDSILFFHRMKLRNNTHFQVKSLENDLANMALTARLSLNDLHILGAYERASTLSDPVQLFYTPTYGEVEFLLKNVEYNMEGRYRMLRDKLAIELIISNINVNDILLTYQNSQKAGKSVVLERKNIDEFLDRLKIGLDKWLKDYFNDYLMYFGLVGEKANAQFIEYNKEKTIALNEYTDKMLEKIGGRIRELKICAVRLPQFSIAAVNGMQLKLTRGVLRGLESLHRRSLATGKRENELRKVDAIVGFSSLKATYQYEAVFNTGVPPINGMLVVTADEMIAHFSLTLTEDPKSGDLIFDSIQQLQPESLTLEGPANRIIGNFKGLLERHVFTFISNAIIHNIIMLRTMTKCEPLLFSIHHTCEEEDINDDNKKEKQALPTVDNKDPNLENAEPDINSNTANDNENLGVDVPQDEQKENEVLSNGGEENNKTVEAEVEITANTDNTKDNSEINSNVDNNKEGSKNSDDNIEANRDVDTNDDNVNNENTDDNTETNRDLNTKNEKENNENVDDNAATNRGLDTNDDNGNENTNDNAETNRDLDTNNDNENENTDDNTETNRDLDTNNDNENENTDDNTETNRELDTNNDNENENTDDNTEATRDLDTKNDNENENTDDNTETNRDLDTNNDNENENTDDNTETNRDLDTNDDKENKKIVKLSLSNAGLDDEINSSS